MASNYTSNYGLCQWEGTDQVLREEFNEDNRKLDSIIHSLAIDIPRYASGTYVGAGEYGASHPNVLTFDFKPEVVVCYDRSSYNTPAIFIRGETIYYMDYGNGYAKHNLTWGENSVSWYNTEDKYQQLNYESTTYRYLAFGW